MISHPRGCDKYWITLRRNQIFVLGLLAPEILKIDLMKNGHTYFLQYILNSRNPQNRFDEKWTHILLRSRSRMYFIFEEGFGPDTIDTSSDHNQPSQIRSRSITSAGGYTAYLFGLHLCISVHIK